MGTIIFLRFPFWIISLINYTVFMEKRLYGKPLMRVDTFTPSEYVSVCWYVKSGDCYRNLYHDTQISYVWFSNQYGYYNDGENVYSATSRTLSHTHDYDIHPSNQPYFQTENYPQPIINDNKCYTSMEYHLISGWNGFEYTNPVSGKIYTIDFNGTKHYYKDYTQYGNHS